MPIIIGVLLTKYLLLDDKQDKKTLMRRKKARSNFDYKLNKKGKAFLFYEIWKWTILSVIPQ